MSHDSGTVDQAVQQETLGDRIRGIADQLKQETQVQIKATSRILGAAAQISENHDRLIEQVVEMVEEDLDQQAQMQAAQVVTVEQLKRQFTTLKQAKAQLGVKANSWDALVEKLNGQPKAASVNPDGLATAPRLDAIEAELKALRTDLNQVLTVLAMILNKVS